MSQCRGKSALGSARVFVRESVDVFMKGRKTLEAEKGGQVVTKGEGNLQDDKFGGSQGQDWKQGKADDEAGKCSNVAGSENHQPIPSTYYNAKRYVSFGS